jgi:hypothetical protein
VGVVLHGLCHGERIGGGVGKLCGTSRGVVGVSSPATERKQSETERNRAKSSPATERNRAGISET